MNVSPLPTRGGIHLDRRGAGRSLRIDAHPGLVTLSLWRHDECVGTHQLDPNEVTELIELLASALGDSLETAHPAAS